jgi:FMN phosphatase YigB (HAD superfamily)
MKTIVWDLDDVLNNLMEAWLTQAWQPEHPERRLSYSRLHSNPPLRELRVTRRVYLASLDRFRLSDAGRNLAPNPLVLEWFRRYGSRFHHHVLTARPVQTAASAAEWIFTHFGKWVRDFHFVPSPRPSERLPHYENNKATVLSRLGPVDFFVDDSPENVRAAQASGFRALLFPQPWNSSRQTTVGLLDELGIKFRSAND